MQKAFWQSIIDKDFALPADKRVEELTPELLTSLESTDPELRDTIAYPILAQWIESGKYSPDQLRKMLHQLEANLAKGLGETGTDSVFQRAFSTLILCEIVSYDSRERFLEVEEIQSLVDTAISTLEAERDLRGHIQKKGWAHAIAHMSDLFGLLALHPLLEAPDLERLLTAIATKISEPGNHVYLYLEDERLALAVTFALRRNLLQMSFLNSWLDQLAQVGLPFQEIDLITFVPPAQVSAYHNVLVFLRSLYFQLAFSKAPIQLITELLIAIEDTLKTLDHGFYTQYDVIQTPDQDAVPEDDYAPVSVID